MDIPSIIKAISIWFCVVPLLLIFAVVFLVAGVMGLVDWISTRRMK
jgi:hypothetical protein